MVDFSIERAELPKPEYQYITKGEDVGRAVNEILQYPQTEFDTETTGFDPQTSKVVLAQFGVGGKAFVFDVRHDTDHSSVHLEQLKPVLANKDIKKLIQNSVFDMKMVKHHGGYYIENIYDTMLVEQLFNLGLTARGASLAELVKKYLGLEMTKEPATTFVDYNQVYQPFQLEYAASDVTPLGLIKDLQEPRIQKEGFENVCRLEFEFTKAMCEMELNGISIDADKWRIVMKEIEIERLEVLNIINGLVGKTHGRNMLFGVPAINIDSNKQLLKTLNAYGISLTSTGEKELAKFKGVPLIDNLLKYRKYNKLMSTYGESLLEKINPITGRLHTRFRQMVSTGRMSSSNPNLQNIPKKQIYRSCFVAKPGYSLVTADMSGAELRILGNLSGDSIFIDCYARGIDLHTRTASEVFDIPMEHILKEQRGQAKSINFGLCYGLTKYGLSDRLGITEKVAEDMINKYFERYSGVKNYLESSARNAIKTGFSSTVAGRKRFYNVPPYGHPDRKKVQRSVERAAKNAGIQGCLGFYTKINGIGDIGNQVDKTVEIETGFGKDNAIGVYSGKKELYTLILSNGNSLDITLDHKIPVVSRVASTENVSDRSVEELSEDDLIMIPAVIQEGFPTDLTGYKYEKGHWRETFVDFKLPEKMLPDLAFIIGSLIGDGSYSKYNYFSFTCPTTQRELLDKFNKCVYTVFKYKPIETLNHKDDPKRQPLPVVQVSSVVIRGFLKHIGLDYVINRYKVIPDYFYTETTENRGALLNGLFSTDGGLNKHGSASYTSTSFELASGIQKLLLTLGIGSALKCYTNRYGAVYRLNVYKRFNSKFLQYVGFSVNSKQDKLKAASCDIVGQDNSVVPQFIPKTIERVLRRNPNYLKDYTKNDKAHLRQFKLGHCSYSSWRKFYKRLPECEEKTMLSKYINMDFCYKKELHYKGEEDTYDLMCDNIHYFIANGIILHNSNADTIKESMIIVVDRLEKSGLDAKLLLTVHDEVIIESHDSCVEEVRSIVAQSLVDGFGRYFSKIPMETDALIGPCWLKGSCENRVEDKKCGSTKMKFIEDKKLGTKLVCAKCGAPQD